MSGSDATGRRDAELLASGLMALVHRDWIEAQQEESKSMRRTLDRLSDRIGSIEKTGSK